MKKTFEGYLRGENLAENSIAAYLSAVELYKKKIGKISKKGIEQFKEFLIKNYKPQTVNLRLIGLSKYLKFLKKEKLRPKLIKERRKNYLQDVIANSDYEILKNSLKNDGKLKWHFIVRYLGSTGVRVSELVQLKIEDVTRGFADICSKGEKTRRIYIPKNLQTDTLKWLASTDRNEGPLFLNQKGESISPHGISVQLKTFARAYNIEEKTVHPHSFRHLFAKNFLKNNGDITLLADLLGHESLDTTRIYLRKSSEEQKNIINDIVDW